MSLTPYEKYLTQIGKAVEECLSTNAIIVRNDSTQNSQTEQGTINSAPSNAGRQKERDS